MAGMILKEPVDKTRTIAAFRARANIELRTEVDTHPVNSAQSHKPAAMRRKRSFIRAEAPSLEEQAALIEPVLKSSSFWRVASSSNPPLRIGLLVDGVRMSRFFATIIEDIQASNFANIEFLIFRKTAEPSAAAARSGMARLAHRLLNADLRKHTLYDQYLQLDEGKRPANHPLEIVDCSARLAGIDRIDVEPIGKKFVHRFPPEALEAIRARNLDVLLRFGFNILKGDILKAARYGIWSYHHGDNDFYRGGPPHFWELCENAPLSGVILQVLTEDLDAGLVLCKSLFSTETTVSVSRNRFPAYWGSTDRVIRKLNELHRFGWNHLLEHAVPTAPYQGKRKIYRTPTNLEMVRWLAPVVAKKGVQRLLSRKSQVQHWRIGVRVNAPRLFEQTAAPDLAGFRWLEPPPGYFWADPFVVEHNGRPWAFYEEYSYPNSRAHICSAQIAADGSFLSPTRCLVSDKFHYSYPHVFRAGSDLFMVPESFDSSSVDLYRCEEFPAKWSLVTTLFRGRFVDTSIWQHDNIWWLMTTTAEPDARSGTLLLFYSDTMSGPWQFHPANPISTDIRNNRNAGGVFETNSYLVRPSQNCSGRYGRDLSLNQITELTKERYAERKLLTLEPDPSSAINGIHTYNWCGKIELIDGQTTTALKR